MKKFYNTCAAIAVVLASPAIASDADVLPSADDDIAIYRTAGPWTVYQNNTRKHCLIAQKGDNGGLVQMGLSKSGDYGYVGAFSQSAEVQEGLKEVVVLVNDNVYTGEASGVGTGLEDGYKGGYIRVNNPNFVKDLEKEGEMIAFPDTPYIYTINLAGTKNAIYEARKCTEELQ
ncbi:hypothetical protein ROA7450_02249 [Roseovarius albus]|uniref:Invasion associated locus B (IalB) protein n=1 Tax=Roseovarius albus TaxID=1247867 RepID=A0A1X6ZCU8_9RHOB|nr:hypothetical protein [Roseovarius albus]SLN46011.1 hypothetical protein ROA7450_02249 [Roseovarius albus]